ncbi:MAG: c-type cytochrome, partial [Planctomycetaceae bacterium]|nr:c-type cytochrome [Planctomycetaceae bacterium]
IGCATCHPGDPATSKGDFTDHKGHDVGTRGPYDRTEIFFSPTLQECWRTAPYFHDGRYVTIKEIFTEGQHGSSFGADIESLTNQQVDDLTEYILSL